MRIVIADGQDLIRRGLKVLFESSGDIEVVGEVSDGASVLRAALIRARTDATAAQPLLTKPVMKCGRDSQGFGLYGRRMS